MSDSSPQAALARRIENAGHAMGQYITRGPSIPPEEMKAVGLERARARLDASPYAEHHKAAGWVAVEQAFVAAANPTPHARYSPSYFLEMANGSFVAALERHDKNVDRVDQPLQIDLAMASVALYGCWLTGQEVGPEPLATFHEKVIGVGRKLADLKTEPPKNRPNATLAHKHMNGLLAELVTLWAFNRRQITGGKCTTFAVPSTLRQNLSVWKGAHSLEPNPQAKLRSNWDISVVSRDGELWGLSDKLQVKRIAAPDKKSEYEKQRPGYTDDITVIGLEDDILAPLEIDCWDVLGILTNTSGTGSTTKQKKVATAISRRLYEHIEADRKRRAA